MNQLGPGGKMIYRTAARKYSCIRIYRWPSLWAEHLFYFRFLPSRYKNFPDFHSSLPALTLANASLIPFPSCPVIFFLLPFRPLSAHSMQTPSPSVTW